MARPREFEFDDAVSRAMDVFWEFGYDATTTEQLLKGMKLTRGSLYKAFGDKKQLFLRTLQLYDQQEIDKAVSILTNNSTHGGARIRVLFSSIVDAVEAGNSVGCLLCSTLSGDSATDPDIALRTMASAMKMRNAFTVALTDIRDHELPNNYASFLFAQYVGVRMLSRARVPTSLIRESVAAIDTFLDA